MSSERYSVEQIREYWSNQAREHGAAPSASWSDFRVVDMEIQRILSYLEDGDRVLDVGCANGYSTVQFAAQKRIQILGVDYIPEMIEQAHRQRAEFPTPLAGTADFEVGDIAHLATPVVPYDKVIVVRVIINLHDWEQQCVALHSCASVLRPGGLLLLSEATIQGAARLNSLRSEWQLPPIPMPPFNLYVDEGHVVTELSKSMDLVEVVDFASTYYVGTRFLKPLLIRALGASIDVADPTMEWNRWFSQLPAVGDYGTQKLFVFRKR